MVSRISLLALLLVQRSYASGPPVKVELRSSWPAPPPLLEAIETISLEDPASFFPLLDKLTAPEDGERKRTPEELYDHVLGAATFWGYLSQPGQQGAVRLNAGLHAATPKIEASYQYYLDRHAERKGASQGEECGSWVDWYGDIVCDVQQLAHLAAVETIDAGPGAGSNAAYARPKLLSFDHVYPSPETQLEPPPRTAILYGSLSSKNFRELHSYLYRLSSAPNPHLEYVFRPIPEEGLDLSQKSYLSGYGVALDLKKMDYLALDDRRQASGEGAVETDEGEEQASIADAVAALLQQYPEAADLDASTPLTDDELLEIGLQATQLIYDSEDPLATLKQLSQNFPRYAAPLARRVTVKPELLDEVEENQFKAQGGLSAAWLNGVSIAERDMNPFALLRLLRKERGIMLSLLSLGLTEEQAITLLTHPLIDAAQSESEAVSELFDASDRTEGGDVIVWWNDFEKDKRYANWGRSLRILMRPMYPGQIPSVKANLYNVVIAVDLSRLNSLNFATTTISNLIGRNLPIRFGVVPLTETEEGTQMARLFYHLVEHLGRARTMAFFKSVIQRVSAASYLTPQVYWSTLRHEFQTLLTPGELPEGFVTDLDRILNGDVAQDSIDKGRAYAARLGATLTSSPTGHGFINGKHILVNDETLQHLQLELGYQLQYLQEQVAASKLTDEHLDTISTYFYDLPGTAKKRNLYIHSGDVSVIGLPDLLVKSNFPFLDSEADFVYPAGTQQVPLSIFIVADLDSSEGQSFVKEALKSMSRDSQARLTFVHNPTSLDIPLDPLPPTSSILSGLIAKKALHLVSPAQLLAVLGLNEPVDASENPQVTLSSEDTLSDILGDGSLGDNNRASYEWFVKAGRFLVREVGVKPGEQAIIINGRIVGPIIPGEFVAEDFDMLSAYEIPKRVTPIVETLEDILGPELIEGLDRASYSDLVSTVSSVISAMQIPDPSEAGLFNTPRRTRRRTYQLLDGEYTSFKLGDNSTALFHFGILVDPLSESAQKWSSLLEWLLNIPEVHVELHINPARYKELPLKRFYRYNLRPDIIFDTDGNEIRSQTKFADLAIDPIYTLAMDVPQSWLVRPREALYDLDNIQLSALSTLDRTHGVHAMFELDYLVIEGHARDTHTHSPPRGLQLQLTTSRDVPIADTLVVANLGYLQFRTTPGVFRPEIRPGRGREIFKIESVGNEGWHSPSVNESGDEVALTSFEGLTLYPKFARLPGMERADVLAEPPQKESSSMDLLDNLISRVTSLFSPQQVEEKSLAVTEREQADINIFTVASGLLYERFASIMVLSVLRNTNSTVKFWFIENFLSPSFLEFIPHFAREYNFQYELVTYKWPSWLRAQKEKQRIIWAYKILFLDVLFPMDLKKVIFVDADQIVRADLKELVDLDLHGAPYGYTPMGDDNEEMEGFRFWKTGYWKEFLRGLPYHISALYVVDLVRFRQIAAGDILRGHYQQLSADPNSLANLDQDLPNNLQREVPIFSLPEDWLWCETWCSKDRLSRAKTIDLCQNPLTKEPKLERARHIPEWEEYDHEISRFAQRLADGGRIRSGIVAADSKVLADVGSGRRALDTNVATDGDHPRDEL